MTDNFTKVPNAILEALIRHRFTGAQYTVLLYVIRKTRGWGKTSDKISVSMIARESGYSRREIINSVRDLEKKKVIKAKRDRDSMMSEMSVNDPKKWDRGVKSSSHVNCSSQKGVKFSSHTKEKKEERLSAGADVALLREEDYENMTDEERVEAVRRYVNEYL